MVVRRRAVVAALALAVLLAHIAAIDWLADRWQPPASKKPFPKPMYTRQITPQAPPVAPKSASNVPAARVQPARPAITAIAKQASRAEPSARYAKPEKPASSAASAADSHSAPRAATGTGETPPAALPALPNPESGAEAPPPLASAEPKSDAPAKPEADAAAPAASAQAAQAHDDPAAGWPTDTRLSYELGGYYLGELHGSAQMLWQRDGDDYEAVLEIDLGLLANLRLTSRGRITARGLAPQFYEELQRTRRRVLRLEESSVVLNDGRRVERPAQVQDTASQFVELAHGFQTGRVALDAGKSLGFWLARPGGIGWWSYDVVDKVTLPTPRLGAVEAWHLKPQPLVQPGGNNISAEIWFAPSLQYLPVKIRVSLNENAWVELIVKRIDQR